MREDCRRRMTGPATPAPRALFTPTTDGFDLPGFIESHLETSNGRLYAEVVGAVERVLLARVLRHTHVRQAQAADLLGVNRRTLRHRFRTLGLAWNASWSRNRRGKWPAARVRRASVSRRMALPGWDSGRLDCDRLTDPTLPAFTYLDPHKSVPFFRGAAEEHAETARNTWGAVDSFPLREENARPEQPPGRSLAPPRGNFQPQRIPLAGACAGGASQGGDGIALALGCGTPGHDRSVIAQRRARPDEGCPGWY